MHRFALTCVLLLPAVVSAETLSTTVTAYTSKNGTVLVADPAQAFTLSITAQPTPAAFLNGQTLDQITVDKPQQGEFGFALSVGDSSIPEIVLETVLRMNCLH